MLNYHRTDQYYGIHYVQNLFLKENKLSIIIFFYVIFWSLKLLPILNSITLKFNKRYFKISNLSSYYISYISIHISVYNG